MNIYHYSYRTPQEAVQQTQVITSKHALQQLQEDYRRNYQQLKSIESVYGLQQLNNNEKQFLLDMDQCIQYSCQHEIDQLSRIDLS
ncbi:SNF2_family chromodomain helicase-DNA-binding protein [Hexamita inflata]|uniref:SNF2 family chromodomain helicase-DNA-binding protein n=1 Tax=Hexamita inflata TaxID=28002 RepID=A0AA86TCX7_9EUKA|nr:SNF2 family chromodomain helicase-DNA-binding protein [Hexamita inflata]